MDITKAIIEALLLVTKEYLNFQGTQDRGDKFFTFF